MKNFVSKSVKGLSSGVIKWIRGLTKFEKLLLGLAIAPWGLLAILIMLAISLDLIGNYQFKKEQERLKARLSEITPQIQEVKTKQVEVRLTDNEIKSLPEFKQCVEQQKAIPTFSIFPNSYPDDRMAELSCNLKLTKKTKTVTEETRLDCSHYVSTGRKPETDLEKEYCRIKNELSRTYLGRLDGSSLNDFEFFIKTGLIFGGLFIGVEIFKYTIRAALDKNNHA